MKVIVFAANGTGEVMRLFKFPVKPVVRLHILFNLYESGVKLSQVRFKTNYLAIEDYNIKRL